VGEEAGEEGSGAWEAGAYYCYVAFDCGPGCCAGVVICFVAVSTEALSGRRGGGGGGGWTYRLGLKSWK
jgi:hypothetical protein